MTILTKEEMRRLSRPERQIYAGVGTMVRLCINEGMSLHALSYQMGLPSQTLYRQVRQTKRSRVDLNATAKHLWFFRRYFQKDLRPSVLLPLVEDGRDDLGEIAVLDALHRAPRLTTPDLPLYEQRYMRFRLADWLEESGGRSIMEVCLLAGLPYSTGMRAVHRQWMDRIETNTLERTAAAMTVLFRRPFTIDDLIEFPSKAKSEVMGEERETDEQNDSSDE